MSFDGYWPSHLETRIRDMQAARVLNCEMEAGITLTLAGLFGLRAGCICVVSDRTPWSGPAELDLDPATEIRFEVDDATVYHGGVEYNWITRGKVNFALRVGYFNAPDNRIRMTQFNSNNQDVNDVFLDLFRGGEDEDHYTVGFSVIAAAGFQFQAAGDFSDSGDEYLASAIYRFGKVRR